MLEPALDYVKDGIERLDAQATAATASGEVN